MRSPPSQDLGGFFFFTYPVGSPLLLTLSELLRLFATRKLFRLPLLFKLLGLHVGFNLTRTLHPARKK